MTYARARLWIGITGVGTIVVACVLGLALDVPRSVLEGPPQDHQWLPRVVFEGPPLDLWSVAHGLFSLLLHAALVMFPLDFLGGYILPRRFGRKYPSFHVFIIGWLRGVFLLSIVTAGFGTLILAAGRMGGGGLALSAFAFLCLLLLEMQCALARILGRMDDSFDSASPERLFENHDPGFTGGFTGLVPYSVMPVAWSKWTDPAELAVLRKRRKWIIRSGTWRRTQLLAVAWNTLGFALASLLPGAGFVTLPELVTTILGFTLWTFLGLLFLPKISRQATLNVDRASLDSEEEREAWARVLAALDKLQDDEPVRSKELESVFHPIPSLTRRTESLKSTESAGSTTGWHLARTALYLSYAGLSLLPRAVHCNAGRPELWVYMPSDG